VPGASQYGTPVRGLYLCGAETHSGGGVTGVPGFNAAREIVKAQWGPQEGRPVLPGCARKTPPS
jgi:phytoene dehydrogenase-like protein